MSATLIQSEGQYYSMPGLDQDLFTPNLLEQVDFIEYDPHTLCEDGEMYSISEFSKSKFTIDIIMKTFNSSDYNLLKKNQSKKYILHITENIYYFNRITKNMIRPQKFIGIFDKDEYEYKSVKNVISIPSKPDAIYDKEKDILYFLKLENIKAFFPEIESLYREATEKEVGDFLNSKFIKTGNKFKSEDVKVLNRKKIALNLKQISELTEADIRNLDDYIKRYMHESHVEDGKIIIDSNKTLTTILNALDERFYTTELHHEPRVANSIKKLTV